MPKRQVNIVLAGCIVFGLAVVAPIALTDPFHRRCDHAGESLGPPVQLTPAGVALSGIADTQYEIEYPANYDPPESDNPKVLQRFQLTTTRGHHVATFIADHLGRATINAMPVNSGRTLTAVVTVRCHQSSDGRT